MELDVFNQLIFVQHIPVIKQHVNSLKEIVFHVQEEQVLVIVEINYVQMLQLLTLKILIVVTF